ncbi:MAG: phosphatidylglycerophosphatase A [Pyrinomonadaceae bacterium]
MPILKESSDELNPPVVTAGVNISAPANRRSLSDYLALAIATCGVGYLPLAPGTWGSIVGVGLYLLWQVAWLKFFIAFGDGHGIRMGFVYLWTTLTLCLIGCLTMAGVWAATRVEKLLGRKDPGVVVMDEVAGQFITFLPLALIGYESLNWPIIVAGFILFRVFDIWKPYPVRRLEALESGLGIMADDVLAGAYAATLLSLLTSIYLLLD